MEFYEGLVVFLALIANTFLVAFYLGYLRPKAGELGVKQLYGCIFCPQRLAGSSALDGKKEGSKGDDGAENSHNNTNVGI